jgi:hypothetical protein
MGIAEILMLAMLTGGNALPDVVAFVPPRDYFETREVAVSAETMMDYATRMPTDAKTQVGQLLALRLLEADPDLLKKSAKGSEYRRTLEQIAAGTKAQDPQGFAQDYALRVLARLDGKRPAPLPATGVKEGLTWLPADAAILYGVDLGGGTGEHTLGLEPLFKLVPPQAKKEMYNVLEEIGNIRVQRIAAGLLPIGEGPGKRMEIYVRLTGKYNPERLVGLATNKGRMEIERKQGPNGEAQIYLREPKRFIDKKEITKDGGIKVQRVEASSAPTIVLLGDREVIVAGAEGAGNDSPRILDKLFAVRAGQQPNATAGILKERLDKVPAKAIALLIGDIPSNSAAFMPGVTLTKVDAFVERTDVGLDVQTVATMGAPGQAETAVAMISQGRMQGIAALKMIQDQPPIPGLPVLELINLLESMQVQQQAERVNIRLLVPGNVLSTLPMAAGAFMVRWGANAPPVQAVPLPPQKK